MASPVSLSGYDGPSGHSFFLIVHLLLTVSAGQPHSTPVVETGDNSVPSEGYVAVPGDIVGCHTRRMLLAHGGQTAGALLNIFQCTGQRTTERIELQVSVLRGENAHLGHPTLLPVSCVARASCVVSPKNVNRESRLIQSQYTSGSLGGSGSHKPWGITLWYRQKRRQALLCRAKEETCQPAWRVSAQVLGVGGEAGEAQLQRWASPRGRTTLSSRARAAVTKHRGLGG